MMKVLESWEIAKVAGGMRVFSGGEAAQFQPSHEGSLLWGRIDYDANGVEIGTTVGILNMNTGTITELIRTENLDPGNPNSIDFRITTAEGTITATTNYSAYGEEQSLYVDGVGSVFISDLGMTYEFEPPVLQGIDEWLLLGEQQYGNDYSWSGMYDYTDNTYYD